MKQIITKNNSSKKHRTKRVISTLISSLLLVVALTNFSYGQCSCAKTVAAGSDWPAYVAGQTVCITGTGAFPQNGNRPDQICIVSGANISINGDLNGTGWNISVYGTLSLGQWASFPETSTITIKNGGVFNFAGTEMKANGSSLSNLVVETGGTAVIDSKSIGNLVKITNAGTVEFSYNAEIDFQGRLNNSGTVKTSDGNQNAVLKLNPGGSSTEGIVNSGTILVANFENHVAIANVSFTNSGSITAKGILYNHGKLTTTSTGSLNTTCEIATSPTSLSTIPPKTFLVGDKEAGQFVNKGVFRICGNAIVTGQVNLDGGKMIVAGDLEINKLITGNNGAIQVSGTATGNPGSGGNYTGTGMTFHNTSKPTTGIANITPGAGSYTITSTPLPVKLKSFDLASSEGRVLLTWTTSMEENSEKFEVERSSDVKTWLTVATVKASGVATSLKYYSFNDAQLSGTRYYRLKMIDLDGKFTYSSIKSISASNTKADLFLYPNPTKGNIKINDNNWSKARQVFVYDALGKIVLKEEASALVDQQLNTQSLSPGVYHVRIVYGDGSKVTYSFKMTK